MSRKLSEALEMQKLIREAEGLGDEFTITLARLKAAMVSARQAPDVHVATGQKALMKLSRAEQNITAAMNDIFGVHAELSEIGRVVGINDHSDITTAFDEGTIGLSEPVPA
jgi:hypothetical protein